MAVLGAAPLLASDSGGTSIRRVPLWTGARELGDLKANVEGKPARVLRVRSPQDHLLLMLVLDLTGDLTLVNPAREAMAAEIQGLPPETWVSLLRAQDGLRVISDPTPDHQAIVAAMQEVQVTGRAGLLESVEQSARLSSAVLEKSPVRVAVLYVTDSNIYNYREDYTNPVINPSDQSDLSRKFPEALIKEKTAKMAAALAETEAPIFVTHLAFLRDRLNEAYQTGLQQMAEATGGRAVFCRTVGDIPATMAQTFEHLRAMWAVDVELPAGTPRNFTVRLSADGAELQYRTRYATRRRGKE